MSFVKSLWGAICFSLSLSVSLLAFLPNADESQLIFPFVVTAEDIRDLSNSPPGATYEIGHKLYVTLVYDMDGRVRNLVQSDLDRLGITVGTAHQFALDNLTVLAESDQIIKRLVQGPNQMPMMIWGGHWLTSSCMLLPKMNSWFKQELNSESILLNIPQRDMLMMFPNNSKNAYLEIQRFVRQNNDKFLDTISLRLFEITDQGLDPFY